MTGFKDLPTNYSHTTYKAAMNADMANKLWEIDSLDHEHN